jgi:hypothetical protein
MLLLKVKNSRKLDMKWLLENVLKISCFIQKYIEIYLSQEAKIW